MFKDRGEARCPRCRALLSDDEPVYAAPRATPPPSEGLSELDAFAARAAMQPVFRTTVSSWEAPVSESATATAVITEEEVAWDDEELDWNRTFVRDRTEVFGAYDRPPVTSGLAVAALLLSVWWIFGIGSGLGIFFGLRARRQIQRSKGKLVGNGLAITSLALGVAGVIGAVFFLFNLVGNGGASNGAGQGTLNAFGSSQSQTATAGAPTAAPATPGLSLEERQRLRAEQRAAEQAGRNRTVPPAATAQAAAPAPTDEVPPGEGPGDGPADAPAPDDGVPTEIFSKDGTGTTTTEVFNVPNPWDLFWVYDCSSTGGEGAFSISVIGPGEFQPVNQFGTSGYSSERYTTGGDVYLQIDTPCTWSIRVYG